MLWNVCEVGWDVLKAFVWDVLCQDDKNNWNDKYLGLGEWEK